MWRQTDGERVWVGWLSDTGEVSSLGKSPVLHDCCVSNALWGWSGIEFGCFESELNSAKSLWAKRNTVTRQRASGYYYYWEKLWWQLPDTGFSGTHLEPGWSDWNAVRTSWQFGTCPPSVENSWRKAHRQSAPCAEEATMANEEHFVKPDGIERQTAGINFGTRKVTAGSRGRAGQVKRQLLSLLGSASSVFISPWSSFRRVRGSVALPGEAPRTLITYESLFTCCTGFSARCLDERASGCTCTLPEMRAPARVNLRVLRYTLSRVIVEMWDDALPPVRMQWIYKKGINA